MFRIRRVYDMVLPTDRVAVTQMQEILRTQFPALPVGDIARIPDVLRNPLKHRFRSILFVAETTPGHVCGFALLNHEPNLRFCYLDYMAAAVRMTGRGLGGALYARIRREARALDVSGVFFECLPDDPALCHNAAMLKENIARLRFYERFGARPIANTRYETPLKPDKDNPPYLVYDDLGAGRTLWRGETQLIVQAVLERKYGARCPPGYISDVLASFHDDPVVLRAPRYITSPPARTVPMLVPADQQIALVVTDQHAIHHVRERGYVESPVRIATILKELAPLDLCARVAPRHHAGRHIMAVHDPGFATYLRRVCQEIGSRQSVYPYVFPVRNAARPPRDLPVRAGYYCIDTFTPLNRNAYRAARRAVDCSLTAADELLRGQRLAYALVRPPGHHAERCAFGGFCYFNNAAVAAHYLAAYGRIAMLDLDYHHGNGQQNIFYERADVFTVSIHCHPRFAYPYFSGFKDEKGAGPGLGLNLNIPLAEAMDGQRYRRVLAAALQRIARFKPAFLVVPLGLDTAKNDPTGSWSLHAEDFEQNGRMVGALNVPTLVTQEGGYDNHVLGVNARRFLNGLWHGAFAT